MVKFPADQAGSALESMERPLGLSIIEDADVDLGAAKIFSRFNSDDAGETDPRILQPGPENVGYLILDEGLR
jgi:hypothetical protein